MAPDVLDMNQTKGYKRIERTQMTGAIFCIQRSAFCWKSVLGRISPNTRIKGVRIRKAYKSPLDPYMPIKIEVTRAALATSAKLLPARVVERYQEGSFKT